MSKGKSKKLKQLEEDAIIMSAWRVFNQTGNVAHYLLYKRLTEKD
ncbi:MAG: YqzL family protein [Clostridiales bacterium]|nr:YqzL family protein [Clostridiales bacterium]